MKRAAVVLVAALLIVTTLSADEDSARYFADRAGKALEEKQFDDAERLYNKALGELDDFPPAMLGLARVAHAQGNKDVAASRLENCLLECARGMLTVEKRDVRDQAEALLRKIEPARLDFRQAVDFYVGELMTLAHRDEQSCPDVARRCCRRILAVRPEHAVAAAMLKRVGAGSGAGSKSGNETSLFNGVDFTGWTAKPPIWSVSNGNIRGHAPSTTNYARTTTELKGDYTLVVDARIEKRIVSGSLWCLYFGMRGVYDCCIVSFFEEKIRFARYLGTARDLETFFIVENFQVSGGFDNREWHTVRIDVKGDTATVHLNGKKLGEHKGTPGQFDGFTGLMVQGSTLEVRRIATLKR